MAEDRRQQAGRLLKDLADGHDDSRQLDANCLLCLARVEAFARAVQAEQRARDAAIARAYARGVDGLSDPAWNAADQIAEAIEAEEPGQ